MLVAAALLEIDDAEPLGERLERSSSCGQRDPCWLQRHRSPYGVRGRALWRLVVIPSPFFVAHEETGSDHSLTAG